MQKAVKNLVVKIIKRCPCNDFRIFLYRRLLGYSIGNKVKIGRSSINCETVEIGDNVVIRHNNFLSCKNLKIGDGTGIHSDNIIFGWANFSIGKNSRIMNFHYIDVTYDVTIGNNTWIAGRATQFWTHGSIHTKDGTKRMVIELKDNIYIGSNSNIGPGVVIENSNLIGLGSVLINSISSSRNVVLGNPAKIVKEGVDWNEHW